MPRLTPMTADDLNPEQRAVFDAINSGPRGNMGMDGPFGVYVRAPGVGNAAQALGAAIRFGTELQENLKEVGICTVGAFHKAKFEFAAHAVLARKAGVDEAVVEAIRKGETPAFTREDERIVHAFSSELVRNRRVSEATYRKTLDCLGETRLIELVATLGYYTFVSMTLNAFEVPLRDGMRDPFPEIGG
ncbi:MAG: carboxymuconolactone decarboxylase family protein [Gammaproteobacteria bacterium]|nr:carboxymuconolactone decarboxylase family protein [Gammaproteobacteria bacterium]